MVCARAAPAAASIRIVAVMNWKRSSVFMTQVLVAPCRPPAGVGPTGGWAQSSGVQALTCGHLAPGVFLQRRARVDRDLDAPVLLPAGFRAVRRHRLALPEPRGRDVGRDSLGGQVAGRRAGASLGESLVVLGAADG